jgi:signal transduction histidine kinase
LNGSLDAEYVEVRGVVSGYSETEMTLLTPDGTITVTGDMERPLPRFRHRDSLAGSVVRLRGCFTAAWNWDTRQVNGGRFNLYPAVAEVEDPMPADPFSIPETQAANLLEFNAHASALQRTKVAGQIIYARKDGCFLLDDKTGVRLLNATESPPLSAGDRVEAVGFPQLGGPSPVLREARIRKIGHAAMPEPVRLTADGLLDRSHDSTLVQIDALLLGDTRRRSERILEMQAGPAHFIARLRSGQNAWPSLAPGSRLKLTGVYASVNETDTGANPDSFELLLNNSADIVVLQTPSWWTVSRAVGIAGALAGALGLAFVWITVLRRKVEERTAALQEEIETRQLVEQHRVMEQERIRVARDLHDELGAGLTEVGILTSLVKNPAVLPEKKTRYLEQLSDSAKTLVAGLDEIVWAINPQYDSVSSLATYYSLFARRFLDLAGITCRFHVSESFPDFPLESKIRHGVFLAFKEALNNVVRHSGASEVDIEIQCVQDELIISIRDNGRGLAASGLPGNDGLDGMRGRLHQFGGECNVTSKPDFGTSVEFRLNLNGALT